MMKNIGPSILTVLFAVLFVRSAEAAPIVLKASRDTQVSCDTLMFTSGSGNMTIRSHGEIFRATSQVDCSKKAAEVSADNATVFLAADAEPPANLSFDLDAPG